MGLDNYLDFNIGNPKILFSLQTNLSFTASFRTDKDFVL